MERKRRAKPRVAIPEWLEPAWRPIREAWLARGLESPPTPGQRSLLWRVLRAHPDLVGNWIAEVPRDPEDPTTYSIVSHVLARSEQAHLAEHRTELWAGLSEAEKGRWIALEDKTWFVSAERLRPARVRGVGLPIVEPRLNPYRALLLDVEDEVARLRTSMPADDEDF